MKAPVRKFLIREAEGVREADTLVLGTGMTVGRTAGGLPELLGVLGGEAYLQPSGGDDTQAIRDALARAGSVRLAPGTFNVSGTIVVGSGQRVSGSGSYGTVVSSTVAGPAFSLTGQNMTVEDLKVQGASSLLNSGSVGVAVTAAAHVRLRGLQLNTLGRGVSVANSRQVAISDVRALTGRFSAISTTGSCAEMTINNVLASEFDSWALDFAAVESLILNGARTYDSPGALRVSGGNALSLHGITASECPQGILLQNTEGVELGSVKVGVSPFTGTSGIRVEGSTGVAISGCSLRVSGVPLRIVGCQAVTASGIRTEAQHGPHVVVESNATGVAITGIFGFNPAASAATYEVDVSGASGRVVFVQHNFDPARINSGGNFVEL
jgi:hypothetical protein